MDGDDELQALADELGDIRQELAEMTEPMCLQSELTTPT